MSYKIYAPQVQFFVFHLQPSTFFSSDLFGNKPKSPDWLWKTGNDIISKTLEMEFKLEPLIDLDKQEYHPRVPLSRDAPVTDSDYKDTDTKNPQYIQLSKNVSLVNQETLSIKGFIYPIRMYNSYGLWLKLGCLKLENEPEKAMDIQVLRRLNPENCFLSPEKQRYSGQTLIITAGLTPEDAGKKAQELKSIADECIQHFIIKEKGIVPTFNRVYELSNSVFFQYGLSSHLPTCGNILIQLLRDQTNDNQFLISPEDLYDLLFYRARIIKAFQDITRLNDILTYYAQKLLKKFKNFQSDGNNNKLDQEKLNQLKDELITLPIMAQKYDKSLAMLNNLKNEIDFSIKKYSEISQVIYKKSNNKDLLILKTFIDGYWLFYHEQIKEYFRFFKHGYSLIDKAISSVRGQVAIAQAELESNGQEQEKERDFNRQITILAVGSGIGAGGILSNSFATIYSSPNTNNINQASTFREAIILGVVGGLVVMIGIKLLSRTRFIKWLFLK